MPNIREDAAPPHASATTLPPPAALQGGAGAPDGAPLSPASPAHLRWAATALSTLAGTTLTACGGGGGAPDTPPPVSKSGSDSTTGNPTSSTSTGAPTYTQVVSATPEADAARFLSQAGLGATTAGIQALLVATVGGVSGQPDYAGWLARQFAMPQRTDTATKPEDRPLWTRAQEASFGAYGAFAYQGSDMGLDNALWQRLFTAQDELRQRVVLALSELFVVSVRNMPIPFGQLACLAYWDLLEQHCFGNFRTLLEAITLSPAMGVYLSMRGSQRADTVSGRRPDENFARELLQLFTIGLVQLDASGEPVLDATGQAIESYTNADITQLAKVFTGWDFNPPGVPPYAAATTPAYTRQPMTLVGAQHDTSAKAFLNQTLDAGGSDDLGATLDIVFKHANVGPFIARQLIQRLVSSNPEPDHVKRVAKVFADNGFGVRGDLQAVITAVLLDPLAREPLSGAQAERRCKLREPMLRFVQWGRLLRLTSTDGKWSIGDLSAADRLGQSPMRSPSVFNFFRPGYVPLNSGISADGFVAPEFQITDESTVIGYANFMLQHMDGAAQQAISVDHSEWLPWATNPAALVDQLNLVLTGRALAQTTVDVIVAAVAAMPADTTARLTLRVKAALYLMMTSPDYMVQR